MKKKTVTFRCGCGYMIQEAVPFFPWAGKYINDIIQYGKIFHLAQNHAIEVHNKKLDFSLLQFVKSQREQRKNYEKHIIVEKNENNQPLIRFKSAEETKKLLELLQKAQEQERIHKAWEKIKSND